MVLVIVDLIIVKPGYHLSVSGNTVVKGVLALGSNIDSATADTISFQATDDGRLQGKDGSSNGFKNVM